MDKVKMHNDKGSVASVKSEGDFAKADLNIPDPVENLEEIIKGKILKEGKVDIEENQENS